MGWPEPIPGGCREIPLYRNVSRNNFNPIYTIIAYTLVEEADFHWLNNDRWFMYENRNGDCYARRYEWQGGKMVTIDMAREILGLLRYVGKRVGVADHKNHNTLDNRKVGNLRVSTDAQNNQNQVKRGVCQRFKGVSKNGDKYLAKIWVNGLTVCFPSMSTDIEAGQMYKYGSIILHDKFAYYTEISLSEESTRARRWELLGIVVGKLMREGLV